jgi:hypothetical protein
MVVVPPGLAERKHAELEAKLASLDHEFDAWTALSEEGEELEKFHTRVRAIRNCLDAFVSPLEERLAQDAARALDIGVQFERAILELYRVWEFFRSKLALRYVPRLKPYLIAADEFAWKCFEPAQRHIGSAGREPPLLFLNGASSPFTMPRRTAYRAEEVPGEIMSSEELAELLESLPIPVIGVPWFALEHLPDALVIAHEVGHDVQRDLGLDDALDELIAAAVPDADRRPAWLAWRDELFADLFGTVMAGPAFVGTLIDFIAAAPRLVATEQPDPGSSYPTRALRVQLVVRALVKRGFQAEADAYLAGWTSTYAGRGATVYDRDVPAVVEAIIGGPYDALGGAPLDTLDSFTREMQDLAASSARDALRRLRPRASDARVLLAAARLAYEEDRGGYRDVGVAERLVTRICKEQDVGVRGLGAGAPPADDRDARDARAGRSLAAAIARRHGLNLDLDKTSGGHDVQAQEPD